MIALLIILLLSSCSKSEVIISPELDTKAQDTTYYRPKPKPQDTARVPIRFNVGVEDWGEITINN